MEQEEDEDEEEIQRQLQEMEAKMRAMKERLNKKVSKSQASPEERTTATATAAPAARKPSRGAVDIDFRNCNSWQNWEELPKILAIKPAKKIKARIFKLSASFSRNI